VPGTDGRAGMAALVVDERFEIEEFRRVATSSLPGYARPVFLRLLTTLVATGTFKPKKQDFINQGFDPELVGAYLYFDDVRVGRYVRIDADLHAQLTSGAIRL
jgi:fatty-acyl-CoA synthase